jgi:hypothetical protein
MVGIEAVRSPSSSASSSSSGPVIAAKKSVMVKMHHPSYDLISYPVNCALINLQKISK